MQRAQRTFGRFLKRSPNEADVEAMLTDFNDSESMLEKVSAADIRRQERWWVVAQA
jgi:amphiphysin